MSKSIIAPIMSFVQREINFRLLSYRTWFAHTRRKRKSSELSQASFGPFNKDAKPPLTSPADSQPRSIRFSMPMTWTDLFSIEIRSNNIASAWKLPIHDYTSYFITSRTRISILPSLSRSQYRLSSSISSDTSIEKREIPLAIFSKRE